MSSYTLVKELPELLTLRQAIDAYLHSQSRLLSPETIRSYSQALNQLMICFGENALLEELSRGDMVQWRNSLFQEDVSIHTVRKIQGHAATFFNWLVAVGFLEASPLVGVKKPPAPDSGPKAITVADFDRLLEEAGKYRGNKYNFADAYKARNVAILYFLASTGCRVGGLVSARISTFQVLDNGGSVDVTEKARGGGKTRTVYLSETAVLAVLEWFDHRPATGHDFIFCTLEGRAGAGLPLKPDSVRKLLERLGKRAGVEGRVNPHSFRHACAREWLRNGADLQTVSQLLGHSDIHVTAKFYARWSESELRTVHSRVDWTSNE